MELLHTIYLIAITAEAMSGAIMGMRRGMDLFGICLLGTVTALGGGTARDVLLGHYPVGWIAHPEYLTFTIGAAIVTGFIARHLHHLRMVFLLVDGLGLVAFTVIGCDIAMGMGAHPSIVVLAGVITGIFGGLMRDVGAASAANAVALRSGRERKGIREQARSYSGVAVQPGCERRDAGTSMGTGFSPSSAFSPKLAL